MNPSEGNEPPFDSPFKRPKTPLRPIVCERPKCKRHAVNHVGLTALCAQHIRELIGSDDA